MDCKKKINRERKDSRQKNQAGYERVMHMCQTSNRQVRLTVVDKSTVQEQRLGWDKFEIINMWMATRKPEGGGRGVGMDIYREKGNV